MHVIMVWSDNVYKLSVPFGFLSRFIMMMTCFLCESQWWWYKSARVRYVVKTFSKNFFFHTFRFPHPDAHWMEHDKLFSWEMNNILLSFIFIFCMITIFVTFWIWNEKVFHWKLKDIVVDVDLKKTRYVYSSNSIQAQG